MRHTAVEDKSSTSVQPMPPPPARWSVLPDLLIAGGLAAVVGLATVLWVHPSVNSFTIQTHGDQAWVQATVQAAMQTGPFAVNAHLGWFSGFDPWAYPPVGGFGFLAGSWLLGLVGVGSSNALALLLGLAAAAMAVATYAAARLAAPGHVHRAIATVGAFAFGLSPYVLSKMGHFNVALVFLLPATLAAIGYLRPEHRRSRRQIVVAIALLAAVTLLSSLWWQLIVLYLMAGGVFVTLTLRAWAWLRTLTVVALGIVVGAALPVVLSITRQVPGDGWNRQAWDSTQYSGSLTDLIVGSPWLMHMFPTLEELLPGASRELSSIGLVPMLLGLAAVVVALTAYLGAGEEKRLQAGWLFILLQLTLLTFLTLGLGTFSEALLWFVGVESPLRVWSRLVVLVSLVGFLLIAPWMSSRLQRLEPKRLAATVAMVGAVVAVVVGADARSIVMSPPRAVTTLEEQPAITYIRQSIGNCPVAQLPLGTYPDFPLSDGTPVAITYYYRGFVPYLLDPDGYWSYGAMQGSESDNLLRQLGPTLDAPTLMALERAGYCAVLYDEHYAQWLRSKQIGWPAESVHGLQPAWTDGSRFVVYATQSTR